MSDYLDRIFETGDISRDFPIKKRFHIKPYVCGNKSFFTFKGADNYRKDWIILIAKVKGFIER